MRAGPAGNDRDVDDVEKPKIINVGKENAAQDGRGEKCGKEDARKRPVVTYHWY